MICIRTKQLTNLYLYLSFLSIYLFLCPFYQYIYLPIDVLSIYIYQSPFSLSINLSIYCSFLCMYEPICLSFHSLSHFNAVASHLLCRSCFSCNLPTYAFVRLTFKHSLSLSLSLSLCRSLTLLSV